jgi:hypothetical protein
MENRKKKISQRRGNALPDFDVDRIESLYRKTIAEAYCFTMFVPTIFRIQNITDRSGRLSAIRTSIINSFRNVHLLSNMFD